MPMRATMSTTGLPGRSSSRARVRLDAGVFRIGQRPAVAAHGQAHDHASADVGAQRLVARELPLIGGAGVDHGDASCFVPGQLQLGRHLPEVWRHATGQEGVGGGAGVGVRRHDGGAQARVGRCGILVGEVAFVCHRCFLRDGRRPCPRSGRRVRDERDWYHVSGRVRPRSSRSAAVTSVRYAGRSAGFMPVPGAFGARRPALAQSSVPGCSALRGTMGQPAAFGCMMPRMMRGMVSGRCGSGRGSSWPGCRRGAVGGGGSRRCSRDVFRLTDRRVAPGFRRAFWRLTFASENSGLCPILGDVLETKEQVETALNLVHRPTVNILTHYGCGLDVPDDRLQVESMESIQGIGSASRKSESLTNI